MKASEFVSKVSALIDAEGDLEISVSVDISTGDHDAFRRVFGPVIGIESGPEFVILAEGELNES